MTSNELRTSIIVLNWNGIVDTRECLASLQKDGFPSKEIIIWDNGSNPEEYLQLQQEFGSIANILRSEQNIGIAAGNNAAARVANGDIIVLLNNDTIITEGWLEPLLREFDEPDIVACQPKIRSYWERTKFDYTGGCGGFLDAFGYPYTRGRIFFSVEEDRGQYDEVMDIEWGSSACLAIRKTTWNEVGGMHEPLFAYMDEIDLCWRLRALRGRIRIIPSSVIYHKGASTMKKFPVWKKFLEHRNNLLMLTRNLPTKQLLTRLPIRLCLEWASIAYYISKCEWGATIGAFHAFFAFLFAAPAAMRGRINCTVPLGNTQVILGYFLRKQRRWSDVTRRS